MARKKLYTVGNLTVYSCTMADIVELASKPFNKQRCHELRVERAKHTHGKLQGPSLIFSSAVCYGKRRVQRALVDGYNRTEAYLRGLAAIDGEVILMEYEVPNFTTAIEALYDQFDNRKAVKRGRDHVKVFAVAASTCVTSCPACFCRVHYRRPW
jgi:hypothetical protein